MAAGDGFTCVIAEKRVQCWGKNDFGQTDAPEMKGVKKISAGKNHACALSEEGVKCWGDDSYGQTKVPPLDIPTQITVGDNFSCALENGYPKCWGSLTNPIALSVAANHACAIENDRLICWGRNADIIVGDYKGQIRPSLRELQSNGIETCIFSKEGESEESWTIYSCRTEERGENYRETASRTKYGSSTGAQCKIHNSEILECFLRKFGVDTFPLPPQGKITRIEAAGNQLCFVSVFYHDYLKCAQNGKFFEVFWIEPRKDGGKQNWDFSLGGKIPRVLVLTPRSEILHYIFDKNEYKLSAQNDFIAGTSLAVGANHTCASNIVGGVDCWGDNRSGQLNAPAIRNTSALTAYADHSCAIHPDGLSCWGDSQHGQSEVAAKFVTTICTANDPRFNLEDLPVAIGIAQKVSVAARAKLLGEILSTVEARLPKHEKRSPADSVSRYFALSLLLPTLQSGDSAYFRDTFLPALEESRKEFEANLGFSGVSRVPPSEINRMIALRALKATLEVAIELLRKDDQAPIQSALRVVGQAMAAPTEIQMRAVKKEGLAALPILKKLGASSKNAFLIETAEIVLGWIK